jgi:hypothetical protein
MQRADVDIRIDDRPDAFRLKVYGPLAGAAVRELELCWRTGASILHGRDLVVDLSPATAIDGSGKARLPISTTTRLISGLGTTKPVPLAPTSPSPEGLLPHLP